MTSDSEEDQCEDGARCFMCPGKKPIGKMDNAQRCASCHAYFHEGCFSRRLRKKDGSSRCCEKLATTATTSQPSSRCISPAGSLPNQDHLTELIMNLSADLNTKFGALNEELKSQNQLLNKELTTIKENIVDIRNENAELKISLATVTNNLAVANNEVIALKDQVRVLQGTSTLTYRAKRKLFFEFRDMTSRSHNLIFYNIPDSADGNAQDLQKAKDLLSPPPGEGAPKIIRVSRIGVFAINKCRPLAVTLSSPKEVTQYLKRNKSLPNDVQASSDRTNEDRNYLKELRAELEKLNLEDPGHPKTIKFIKGIPTIVHGNTLEPLN